MELFYTTNIQDDRAVFDENETRHITKAYRKRSGDLIQFTDGKGQLFSGLIEEMGRKSISCTIQKAEAVNKSWTGHLTMCIAPTKNFNRTEWLVEKMVEMGIDTIVPLETEHSERKRWKMDRLQRIMVGAVKQSIKTTLPQLVEPLTLQDWLDNRNPAIQVYIGHCREGKKSALRDIQLSGQNVAFLVGPEGDFSKAEIERSITNGAKAITLGTTRLRTETAAFKMATAFQIMNDIL